MNYTKLALKNISSYGDTDIFPYPIENALFYDMSNEAITIVDKMISQMDEIRSGLYPINRVSISVPVGYTGYRWTTFIDPWWNAALLSIVLSISEQIECYRKPALDNCIFSYRIKLNEDTGECFDKDFNWRKFYETSMQKAKQYKCVVRFDIADFYNRIYHHRLDNALENRIGIEKGKVDKIMKVLMTLSGNVSYGLPVGGNAARILAEAYLATIDKVLDTEGVPFCRFVDDFILFAMSKEEAYQFLNISADLLMKSEGLTLQKNKTVIMTSSEFENHAISLLEGEEDLKLDKQRNTFYKMHIHYDPYSLTAIEDYEELKSRIAEFDLISFINSEVKKSKIHQSFAKQIISAIKFLDKDRIELAIAVIIENIESLYTIFPNVIQMIIKVIDGCNENTKVEVREKICRLINEDSYLMQTENNACYIVRLLSHLPETSSSRAINLLYGRPGASELLKSNCILAMVNMKEYEWLSSKKTNYNSMSILEKRAFYSASFYLRDEGAHWRRSIVNFLDEGSKALGEWIATKYPAHTSWKLPI